jgi:hypothetical protein
MSNHDDPSPAIRKAFELVQADSTIEIVEPPHERPDGDIELRCRVEIKPFPNPEHLPDRGRLRVVLDSAFPLRRIDVFVEDREIQGFPHQDAETGKLCLFPDRDAPFDVSRLKVYIDWARQWLADAATSNLLRDGDPFELPDFSRRNVKDKLPTDRPLLFDEDSDTFVSWTRFVGKTGLAELVPSPSVRGFLARTFRAPDGAIIRQREYQEYVANPKQRLFGRWMLLPHLTYFRHRPPQTIAELIEMSTSVGIDLFENLQKAWGENNHPEVSFVLIGCPIPQVVGQPPTEVHWQPLYFSGKHETTRQHQEAHRKHHRRALITTGSTWSSLLHNGAFAPTSPLPWGTSQNISRGRFYARGGQPAIAAMQRVVLAGCGALGCVVAELLARGGVPDLTLFDGDRFEMGNACRHTLDGRDVGLVR